MINPKAPQERTAGGGVGKTQDAAIAAHKSNQAKAISDHMGKVAASGAALQDMHVGNAAACKKC